MSAPDPIEDDAFVRTAVRGMRPPDHHPDFWDALAGRFDELEDEQRMDTAIGPPGSLDDRPAKPRHARRAAPRAAAAAAPVPAVDHPPRRAPLRARPVAQVPEAATAMDAMGAVEAPTEVAPQTRPQPAPSSAQGLPAADAPRVQVFIPASAAATTAASLAGRGVRAVADPLARLTVRHDPATLPHSMRRTSNAVLLGLAVLAMVIALVATVSLVRQRSDSSAPPIPTSGSRSTSALSIPAE